MLRVSRIIAAAMLAFTLPAKANDSQAEIVIGGLTLKQSDAIRLDSEDLYISREEVRVNYRFTNTANRDIETLVAFPLPEWEPSPITAIPDFRKELNFRTMVEGQPVTLDFVEQALANGRDVTALLKQHAIPIMPIPEPFDAAINRLPAPVRAGLIKDKLIEEDGEANGVKSWMAHWKIVTNVTRKQVFPAGKTISVEHRYKPFAGGSVPGAYNPDARKQEYFRERAQKFCIDNDFLRGFDGRLAKMRDKLAYNEIWLGYALKPGANWLGPIRDFRLVVDKGAPDALVSFCAKGVKKISPTQFEVRYTDFKPTQDIAILILDFIKP